MLSTISGTPCRCATFASASMSQMLPAGLPMLSQKTAVRVVVDQLLDRVGLHPTSAKRTVDALARQEVREQRVRRAVELRHRHDVAAHVGDVEDRVVERRLAGADAQRLDAAFERGDAPLQHGGGRIADAAVAIAFDFEIEQSGAVIGAVELVGDGLIDRNRDGAWSSARSRSRRGLRSCRFSFCPSRDRVLRGRECRCVAHGLLSGPTSTFLYRASDLDVAAYQQRSMKRTMRTR